MIGRKQIGALCLIVLLAIAIAQGILLAEEHTGEYYVSFMLILSIIVLLIIFIFRSVKKHQFFNPGVIVATLFLLEYGLRPLYLLIFQNLNILHVSLSRNEAIILVNKGLLYSLIGIISFYIGYKLNMKVRFARRHFIRDNWNFFRVEVIVIVFSLIGLALWCLYIVSIGGFQSAFYFMATYRAGFTGVGTFVRFLMWGIFLQPVATLIWCAYIWKTGRSSHLIWIQVLGSVLILISLGGREKLCLFILTIAALRHFLMKRLGTRSIITLLGFLIVGALIMGIFRGTTVRGFERLRFYERLSVKTGSVGLLADSVIREFPEFDAFIAILTAVPELIPVQYGRCIVELAIAIIPSTLLPFKIGKIEIIGLRLSKIFEPEKYILGWGYAPSLLGLFYMNFLLPGIIIGMFLFGIFCRWLLELHLRNKNSITITLLYSVTLFFLVWTMARSGDIILMGRFYFVILLEILVGIYFVCGKRKHKAFLPPRRHYKIYKQPGKVSNAHSFRLQ